MISRARGLALRALLLALAAAMLAWPAVLNGGPFLFPDTTAYFRMGDAAVYKATGRTTDWSDRVEEAGRPSSARPAGAEPTVLAGRSLYYGLFLHLTAALGGLWGPLVAQCLLAAGFIAMTVEGLLPGRAGAPVVAGAATAILAASTTLPLFCDFLMPDLFVALGAVAVIVLAGHRRLSPAQGLAFTVTACLANLFHASALLLSGLVLVALVAALALRRPVSRMGVAAIAASVAVGLAGEAAFHLAVQRATGGPPVRPPFLIARLIELGPGQRYLERHCETPRFSVCAVRDRLPVPAEAFLWADTPEGGGVFQPLPTEGKRALSAEQVRFALAVAASDPLGLLASVARATWRQGLLTGFDEFDDAPGRRAHLERRAPPGLLREIAGDPHFTGRPALVWLHALSLIATLGSAAIVVGFGLRAARIATPPPDVSVGTMVATLWGCLVLNAALAAALSGEFARYQTRMTWLLPLFAIVLLARRGPMGDGVRRPAGAPGRAEGRAEGKGRA